MPYETVGDLQMYYETAGSSTLPTLLLLHGSGGTGRSRRGQIRQFSEQYRVITPDLREHGRTNNPLGSAAFNHRQYAADIATLCDCLGISRAAFCGESSGSILQLTLALARPDLFAAAIWSSGTYFWPEEQRAWNGGLTVDGFAQAFFPPQGRTAGPRLRSSTSPASMMRRVRTTGGPVERVHLDVVASTRPGLPGRGGSGRDQCAHSSRSWRP